VRNLEIYLVYYSVSYRASYREENSASYWEHNSGRNPAESSSDCPENCRASNPESNLPSNGAENLLSCSESSPADYSDGCLGSFGQSPAASPGRRGVDKGAPSAAGASDNSRPDRRTRGSVLSRLLLLFRCSRCWGQLPPAWQRLDRNRVVLLDETCCASPVDNVDLSL
jgi:hypothetical protein